MPHIQTSFAPRRFIDHGFSLEPLQPMTAPDRRCSASAIEDHQPEALAPSVPGAVWWKMPTFSLVSLSRPNALTAQRIAVPDPQRSSELPRLPHCMRSAAGVLKTAALRGYARQARAGGEAPGVPPLTGATPCLRRCGRVCPGSACAGAGLGGRGEGGKETTWALRRAPGRKSMTAKPLGLILETSRRAAFSPPFPLVSLTLPPGTGLSIYWPLRPPPT